MRSTMILAALVAILTLNGATLAAMYPTSPVMWDGNPGFGPGDANEDSLQEVLNNITVGGDSSVNAATDAIRDDIDSYWSITGSGQSAATMIIELSAWKADTSFGVFDMSDPSNMVTVFAGSATPGYGPGTAVLAILNTGEVGLNNALTGVTFAGNAFGFFISTEDGTWYSDTDLNDDEFDHMLVYQGKNVDNVELAGLSHGLWTDNEFVLAFEDQWGGGDGDWQDLVLMIESVTPVPVPGAVLLGVLGLGAAGMRLRKRQS